MKVVSNTAVSLDGRINTRERRFTFFGSARDHARMSRLRAEADAVLVGGATFRPDTIMAALTAGAATTDGAAHHPYQLTLSPRT